MKNIIQILTAILYIGSFSLLLSKLSAETTTTEKIENSANSTGKAMKKTGRKVKREVRDATGNGSIKEDIKDGANNAKDEVEYQGKKVKKAVD